MNVYYVTFGLKKFVLFFLAIKRYFIKYFFKPMSSCLRLGIKKNTTVWCTKKYLEKK